MLLLVVNFKRYGLMREWLERSKEEDVLLGERRILLILLMWLLLWLTDFTERASKLSKFN